MIKKPNFLILGAAKAGTTSLCDILRQHPQVYFPLYKETTFFSNDIYYNRGMNWYLDTFFNKTDNYLACGEASPQYLYWAEKTAPRIRESLGSETLRFIIILREPVSRAYSWYWNMVKEGNEDLSFEDAIEAEPTRLQTNHEQLYKSGQMTFGYLRGGHYAEQIEFLLSLFPRENFLFLLFDDLSTQFKVVSSQLKSFLKIDPGFILKPTYSNQATRSLILNLRKWMREQLPIKNILKKIITPEQRHHIKKFAMKVNNRPFSYPPMSRSTADALKAQFTDENIRLGKIINRDLSLWNEN